jgi:WD40 repeat protein
MAIYLYLRFLRCFSGHTQRLNSLSMSPVDDCFLSASNDKVVQLWNLSSPNPIGIVPLPPQCEQPCAKFDESGIVFGILCRDNFYRRNVLKLFDARNFEAGPFQDIFPDARLIEAAAVRAARTSTGTGTGSEEEMHSSSSGAAIANQIRRTLQTAWTSFEFSSDGNHLLLNSLGDQLLVLDGFRADVEPLLITARKNDGGVPLGACFSANSKCILTGNEDNDFLVLDKASGELKKALSGHVAPIGCLTSNPKYDVFATGCVNTVLWIPKEKDLPLTS